MLNRLLILDVTSPLHGLGFTIAVHAVGDIHSALEDVWHKFGWTTGVVLISDWALNRNTSEWQLVERYQWR